MAQQAQSYDPTDLISVIIPANNEEPYIDDCLKALAAQDAAAGPVEVLVVANGCTDRTVAFAREHTAAFSARNWTLTVLDLEEPGKINALNVGDRAATGCFIVYHDADIRCDPALLGQLREALSIEAPRYATGSLRVGPASSWVTRQYGRFWTKLPFVAGGAVGAGLYGVNRAGRGRWAEFPDIISDDTYARRQFNPEERIEVPAKYQWPMIEGFQNLVRVRKRQDEGVQELSEQFGSMLREEGKKPLSWRELARLAVADPIGFTVYSCVSLVVRLKRSNREWVRGR